MGLDTSKVWRVPAAVTRGGDYHRVEPDLATILSRLFSSAYWWVSVGLGRRWQCWPRMGSNHTAEKRCRRGTRALGGDRDLLPPEGGAARREPCRLALRITGAPRSARSVCCRELAYRAVPPIYHDARWRAARLWLGHCRPVREVSRREPLGA